MAANKRKADTTIDKPGPAKRAKAIDEATADTANQTSAPEAPAPIHQPDHQDPPDMEAGAASEKVPGTVKTPRRRNKLAPPRPWPTVARADSATGPRSAHKEGKNYICITRKTSLGAYLRRCKDLVLKDGYKTLHLSAMGAAIPHLVQLSVALPPILPYDASEIHSDITTGTIHVHDEIVPDNEDEDITYEKRGKSTLMIVMKIGDGEYEGNDRSKSLERRRRGKRTQTQLRVIRGITAPRMTRPAGDAALIIKTCCHSPASSSLASRPPPGRKPTTQTLPAYRRPAMQAASHGARASVRSAPSLSAWSAVSAPRLARSIHTSHTAKLRHTATSTARNASSSATGGAKGLFERSRAFMNNLVAHLTAPCIGVKPHGPYVGHGYHQAARAPIHSGYSLPLRTALARPALSTPATFLPRAPGVPRSIAQVGLGTARNFSTARPIFQSLAENVPVATRALIEAGPDTRRAKHRAQARKMAKQDKENGRVFRAPEFEKQQKKLTKEEKTAKKEQAMKQYFAAPSQPDVVTQLLIPLAPTPTERVPLAPSTTLAETIMPLMEVASIHATHGSHRMRVASLFDRLDGARVWDRGVSCSAYSQLAGASGVCTVLKVEFVGWTKAEVRSVIGESGTGWCVLEELETATGADLANEDMSGYDSDVLSEISGLTGSEMDAFSEPDLDLSSPSTIDPSQSFVLPTLDFSSSFSATAHSAAASVSDLSSTLSDVGSDAMSDSMGYAAVSSTSSPVFIGPPSENGWYTFSSDFGRRSGMLPGEEKNTQEQGM